MIFHINLFTVKPNVNNKQHDADLDLMRQSGANPTMKSYIMNPKLGEEFEYNAVYLIEDLDSY